MQTLSCSMWDLVFWPKIKPRPPALGAQSLSHWTTSKFPCVGILINTLEPGGTCGKESTCQRRRHRDANLIPRSGRSPGVGNTTCSSTLAWKILWTGEPGRLQSIASQRLDHNWSDCAPMNLPPNTKTWNTGSIYISPTPSSCRTC